MLQILLSPVIMFSMVNSGNLHTMDQVMSPINVTRLKGESVKFSCTLLEKGEKQKSYEFRI